MFDLLALVQVMVCLKNTSIDFDYLLKANEPSLLLIYLHVFATMTYSKEIIPSCIDSSPACGKYG